MSASVPALGPCSDGTSPEHTELDELTITIVVDNATDTLSSNAPGVPQLPEMAYLLGSVEPSGQHDGHNCVVGFDHLCVACHGFRHRPRHDVVTEPHRPDRA